ncbi:hypothetical protein JZM24_00155 [Candidatus Sodalis endolongispinus]|uniref:Uncharacterized protein n=1 Tax=Candidatus Sodalis endolongispinus TaxID=2812662 RepID=A0ABS5Y7K0_9GAMM|nr:hypothetical protein [Candidatus Sodalis endolongispinus]MBT9430981.1 hypothetical protein [Candidatus Sodalis endolongispinus]
MEHIILSHGVRLLVFPGDGYRESAIHRLCPATSRNISQKSNIRGKKGQSPKQTARFFQNIKAFNNMGLVELSLYAQKKYNLSPLLIEH